MAWIELHQSLPTHKKTLRLKKLLGVDTASVIGHLCALWLWALDNAPDGYINELDGETLAEIMFYRGDAEKLIPALIESGYLDADGHIHDWDDYAGRLIVKRMATAERVRTLRERNAYVTRTKRECNANVTPLPYPTVPNHTVPNSTVPVDNVFVPADAETTDKTYGFDEFWKAYPRHDAKQNALKSWQKLKPDAELRQQIIAAVLKNKASQEWQKDNGRYIPMPTTYLNQRRWEDEGVKNITPDYSDPERYKNMELGGFKLPDDNTF